MYSNSLPCSGGNPTKFPPGISGLQQIVSGRGTIGLNFIFIVVALLQTMPVSAQQTEKLFATMVSVSKIGLTHELVPSGMI
jgi:hypothetical protein